MAFAGLSLGKAKSSLEFVEKSEDYQGGSLYQYFPPHPPPAGLPPSNFKYIRHEVFIEDIRGKESDFSIESQGFCLYPFSTQMSHEEIDDKDKIRDILIPEVKEVLQRLTRASIVYIWSHVVRGKYADGRKPSEKAHIDTAESWRQDLFRQYCTMPNSKVVPSHKYEFYNLWVPLLPVKNYPLAFCEPSSVEPDDVLPVIYHGNRARGQNCSLQHNKSQKWYYKSNQQPSEAWIFYQGGNRFDNKPGVPHASFRLDGSDAPRQSIEFKAMVFF